MNNKLIQVISILFVLMLIFLPMGWMLVTYEPPGIFFSTKTGQVDQALEATGMDICKKTDTHWIVAGAEGGNSVIISKDCSNTDSDSAISIHTQKFETEQTRDSALKLIQKSINKHDINGAVFTFGSYVIVVQGKIGENLPIDEISEKVKLALTE